MFFSTHKKEKKKKKTYVLFYLFIYFLFLEKTIVDFIIQYHVIQWEREKISILLIKWSPHSLLQL